MLVKLRISEKREGIYHLDVFEKNQETQGKMHECIFRTRHNKIIVKEQRLGTQVESYNLPIINLWP